VNADYFRLLYDYNEWANRVVLETASALREEQLHAPIPGLAYVSILGTLAHLLGTELSWLSRWQGSPLPAIPGPADFASFAALRDRWEPHARKRRPKPGARLTQPRAIAKLPQNRAKWF